MLRRRPRRQRRAAAPAAAAEFAPLPWPAQPSAPPDKKRFFGITFLIFSIFTSGFGGLASFRKGSTGETTR